MSEPLVTSFPVLELVTEPIRIEKVIIEVEEADEEEENVGGGDMFTSDFAPLTHNQKKCFITHVDAVSIIKQEKMVSNYQQYMKKVKENVKDLVTNVQLEVHDKVDAISKKVDSVQDSFVKESELKR
ncbi:hypothetical protein LXL04_033554 [Taraxacum kok-saghyz]